MTKNRFEEINQYLHFSDSLSKEGGTKLGLYKCCLIHTNVLNSVDDEAMISFKGWMKFRQYMQTKPTKYGIEVWMAADTSNGDVLNFSVYEGIEEGNALVHGLGCDIVMQMKSPYLNKNHHLFLIIIITCFNIY